MTDLRRHVPTLALAWDDDEPGSLWRVLDGTLVYADISGFTALTERLATRGRIGAEEIVEVLNRVFGTMVDTASARGADLLKFGGDALVFLLHGDGHANRACDAAVEMRQSLREAAAVPTSVGRLRLQMSVGIHSGPVHLVLAGEPTRELFVLGPAATATVAMERAAGAGEIVVDPGTAAHLPPGSTRRRDDGALLLRRRSATGAASGTPTRPALDRSRLRTLFPRALGDVLDPAVPDPEHRLATVAFARVTGTDSLLAAGGPDALARAAADTVTLLHECLDAEGVTLLSTDLGADGATFFLASGVPHASDDDEGRMLRAVRRLADTAGPLPFQIGVNRGHVFAAEVGTPGRAAYSAMGDTTNTAARIATHAPLGHVYAHPAVLQHSRTLFASAATGPFAMKGKAVPLVVYDVGEETGTREAAGSSRLPLLGRDPELAILRAVLADGVAGRGGVVTVSGATGVGKSRLVREALAGVDPGSVVVLRAEPYGASASYRVFRDPLRALLGIRRGDPRAMGRQLLASLARTAPHLVDMAPLVADVVQVEVPGTPQADAIDPQFRPDRLAEVLVDLLAAMRPGPLVIVAEEAHWTDRASADLLHRLAAATAGRPWTLIVVRRGAEGGFTPADGTRIELEPLPAPVVARLVVEATQDAPLRPHEVDAIVSRAAGNPLFVEEVTRVARSVGSLEAMPESLSAAMTAQIDVLDPPTRRVLRYAAVLGRSFRREVLRETLASDGLVVDPATLAALSDVLDADGPDRLRFRTGLVRDAAYEGLAYRVRARVHRAAGRAVERLSSDLDVDAATLALHFSRAGDADRTWRYARRAGARARRAYANADAAEQYALALEHTRGLDVPADELVDAWSALGEVRELAGLLTESVDAYRRAAALTADDPVRTADLLARRARVQERAGSYATALRTIARARRLLDDGPDTDAARRTRVRLDALTALVRLGQERPAQARIMALRAAAGARAVGDTETLVQALMAIDPAELHLGMPNDMTHTREALAICVAQGYRPRESIARANLGTHCYEAGRWDEAVDWYQSARRVATEAGNAFGAAETEVNLGDLLVSRGRPDEADAMLGDAVRVLRASGMGFEAAYGDMQRARADLARGRLDAASTRIAAVVAEFAGLGHPMTTAEAELVAADVANASGRPEDALDAVGRAEATMRGDLGPLAARAHLQRARALVRLDRADEAAAAVEAGLADADALGQPYERARLLVVRAGLAGTAGAGDADEAAALLRRLGAAELPVYLR